MDTKQTNKGAFQLERLVLKCLTNTKQKSTNKQKLAILLLEEEQLNTKMKDGIITTMRTEF